MLARVRTGSVNGIDPILIAVEVNLAPGLPTFSVVGLAQGAVREGRERVTAALRNAGFELPHRRITVNLAPADVRKDGAALDLPVAIGLLVASGHVRQEAVAGRAFLGELGLDGTLRPVTGVLPVAARCWSAGIGELVVPSDNAREAGVVEELRAFGARTLEDVVAHLRGTRPLDQARVDLVRLLSRDERSGGELREVRSQGLAKRALEIAAAGAHNVLRLCLEQRGRENRAGRPRSATWGPRVEGSGHGCPWPVSVAVGGRGRLFW